MKGKEQRVGGLERAKVSGFGAALLQSLPVMVTDV